MTIEYRLTSEDYLQHQLYTSSKSEIHKSRRNRGRLIIGISSILLAAFFFVQRNTTGGIVYLMFGTIGYLLHPFYLAWRYKRHFKKHINENLKERINVPIKLAFQDTLITLSDPDSSSKIKSSSLDTLTELPHHFFIKLSNNSTIILPKAALVNHPEFVPNLLEYGLELIDEINWKWR